MTFCPPCDPKHQQVAKSANLEGAVQQFLSSDYESKSMIMRDAAWQAVDEDVLYVVLRDADERLTMEQKIGVFGLFLRYRDGIVFGRGRAMFEMLWRLVSYAPRFVPLVCASLKPKAWQEIANILIKGDSVPAWHYNVMIKICRLFGSWALLVAQQEAIEQLFQTRKAGVDDFSVFDRNQIKANVDDVSEMDAHGCVLVECYGEIAKHYFKRAILDTLGTQPELSDEEIAALVYSQETEEDCFDFFACTGVMPDENIVEMVQRARLLLARKEEICLAAFLN